MHHHELHWHETEGRMGFVVRRMVCEFLKPAQIDDLLTVESRFQELRGARMEIGQRVIRGDELLFSAEVTAALVDANGRPKRMPASIAESITRHLG